MGKDAGEREDGLWPLESGTWRPGKTAGFELVASALGKRCAGTLSVEDLRALLRTGSCRRHPSALYPHEFGYCPTTGEALERAQGVASSTWVPPCGAAPVGSRATRSVRGLRQSATPLRLSMLSSRCAVGDADAVMKLPPPGDYEFMSMRAATQAPVLLAVEPDKGALYAWLPASMEWAPLEHVAGGVLAETRLSRADWGCELAAEGGTSRLFLPTEAGVACVVPDVPALSFEVHYVGGACAVGRPIQFGDLVWAPLRETDTRAMRFVGVDHEGRQASVIELPGGAQIEPGRVHAPVASGRQVVWPCDAGQLQLRRLPDGAIDARFLPWPAQVQPDFDFGCPYLSRDGMLWQLCFDARADSYVYVQLGSEQPGRAQAMTPRTCCGTSNFRFTTRYRSEPWQEPEHGDDAGAAKVVLPLLEQEDAAVAIGLLLETTGSLADLLRSPERVRAVLVHDDGDGDGQREFHTMRVAQPWRTRLFAHDGYLWAYHPMSNSISGWRLA